LTCIVGKTTIFFGTMKVFVVIPARYASSRLPGKPLAIIGTKPMIQWVYERASRVRGVNGVIVATDNRKVAAAVYGFGADVRMTSSRHRTGTERVAEVARSLKADIIVNLQGDVPFVDPRTIEKTMVPLIKEKGVVMATAMYPIFETNVLESRDVVKVVIDMDGYAIYFSRQPIPCYRDGFPGGKAPLGYKHIGIYAYRRDFLLKLSKMKPTPLEKAESLEQLRALERGFRIRVVAAPSDSLHIDTPEDLEKARRLV